MCDKFQEIKKQLLTQVESQMAHLECVDTKEKTDTTETEESFCFKIPRLVFVVKTQVFIHSQCELWKKL